MRKNSCLGAAALLACAAIASPASATVTNVCYKVTVVGQNPATETLRLTVGLAGSNSSWFEKPKVLAYDVQGRGNLTFQGNTFTTGNTGTVLVGVGKGSSMEIVAAGGTFTCYTAEWSPTPNQWTCKLTAVSPETPTNPANARISIVDTTLNKVNPRQEPACSAFEPIPPQAP